MYSGQFSVLSITKVDETSGCLMRSHRFATERGRYFAVFRRRKPGESFTTWHPILKDSFLHCIENVFESLMHSPPNIDKI